MRPRRAPPVPGARPAASPPRRAAAACRAAAAAAAPCCCAAWAALSAHAGPTPSPRRSRWCRRLQPAPRHVGDKAQGYHASPRPGGSPRPCVVRLGGASAPDVGTQRRQNPPASTRLSHDASCLRGMAPAHEKSGALLQPRCLQARIGGWPLRCRHGVCVCAQQETRGQGGEVLQIGRWRGCAGGLDAS